MQINSTYNQSLTATYPDRGRRCNRFRWDQCPLCAWWSSVVYLVSRQISSCTSIWKSVCHADNPTDSPGVDLGVKWIGDISLVPLCTKPSEEVNKSLRNYKWNFELITFLQIVPRGHIYTSVDVYWILGLSFE